MFNNKYKKHTEFLENKIFEEENNLNLRILKIENEMKGIPLNTKELIQQLHERICKLEKTIEKQPLIKKYQKTLDLMLKNAQDKPIPLPRHCCTGMTMEEWESIKK